MFYLKIILYIFFLHAILHVLGYDHEIDSERIKMEKIEISILKNLGIKNPYA